MAKRSTAARRGATLARLRDSTWIAGCERCRSHLLGLCAREGFTPNIAYSSDDMVVMQAVVAAGHGVTTIPGLALRAHRSKGITATELTGADRRVFAATYGEPPDPPATAALLAALAVAASGHANTTNACDRGSAHEPSRCAGIPLESRRVAKADD